MKIAIASDHRGVQLKARLTQLLHSMDFDVHDYGPSEAQSVDYPDFAAQVAREVSNGRTDRGILICGTGIGMCIAANKFAGVRAAPCHDSVTAEYSRMHNDANLSGSIERPVGRSGHTNLAEDAIRRRTTCPPFAKDCGAGTRSLKSVLRTAKV